MIYFFVADINSDAVINFLQDNPSLLEQYIQNFVSEEVVEAWLVNKRKTKANRLRNGDAIYSKLSSVHTYTVSGEMYVHTAMSTEDMKPPCPQSSSHPYDFCAISMSCTCRILN